MKNAFGVTPIPPDHEEDVENERVSRKTMKFGTVELSLGMTKEEVFERLEPQFRLSMLEPDFTRPEQQFWGIAPTGNDDGTASEIGGLTFTDNRLINCSKRIAESKSPETLQFVYALMNSLKELDESEDSHLAKVFVKEGGEERDSHLVVGIGEKDVRLIVNDNQYGGSSLIQITEWLTPISNRGTP
ncbi:MAG: hypothetical protein KC994_20755, partial [Candidatus Omnitrophica bacterium]|nr:hypothetical protein [Candidatus Omnitrophota bacterium]